MKDTWIANAFGASAGGVAAMLVACALFVTGDTCVKLLGREMPLGEIIFLRGLFAAPIVLALAMHAGLLPQLPRVAMNRRIQVRTACEIGSTTLFLAGLIHMSYADAIAIQQFVPLAVIAGAAIFLGDKVGWRRWLAAFVGLVGVLIIVRPGTGALNWPALMVLANIVFVAARDLVTRRLGEGLPSLLIAVMSIVCIGLSGLLLLPFEAWRAPSPWECLLISIAAISSIGGFYWVTEALRRGEIAVVMPFRYSLIPYGALSGLLVFREWPDGQTWLGIAIVFGAGLYALHRERLQTMQARQTASVAPAP